MKLSTFRALCLMTIVTGLFSAGYAEEIPPNVIFFMADDLC